jgi:hypothetical protein
VAVSYRKVRAHTERRQYQEVTQGDSQVRADALGNLQADALAGEGAAVLQLAEPSEAVVFAWNFQVSVFATRSSTLWAVYTHDVVPSPVSREQLDVVFAAVTGAGFGSVPVLLEVAPTVWVSGLNVPKSLPSTDPIERFVPTLNIEGAS